MTPTRRSTALRSTVAALALGVLACAAQAVEMRGFRGVSWGEASVKLGEVSRVSQAGELRCYQRVDENLLFGDAPVQSVRFCFKQDRLFFVAIDSAEPAQALVQEFGRTYGEPTRRAAGRSQWSAPRGLARAEVLAQGTQGSTLHIYSAGSDRQAVKQALALIASTRSAPQAVALAE